MNTVNEVLPFFQLHNVVTKICLHIIK